MDDQPTYRVMFFGKIIPGHKEKQVRENIARIFNQDLSDATQAKKVALIFSGRPFVIKSQLSQDDANRYCAAIRNMGAECQTELDTGTNNPRPHFLERRNENRRKQGDRRSLSRGSSILPDRRSGFGRRKTDPHPDD